MRAAEQGCVGVDHGEVGGMIARKWQLGPSISASLAEHHADDESAADLGFTWLATVPPTAGLVAKLFDTRNLATLLGLTLLTHQVGGFLGAWLAA